MDMKVMPLVDELGWFTRWSYYPGGFVLDRVVLGWIRFIEHMFER
jgi:hypothetical protein